MRYIPMIAGIVLASLVSSQSLLGQSAQKRDTQSGEHLEDAQKRPDLRVDYARVAKFKLGSRKTMYRIGEMISIDLAIMNTSNSPVFFHEPFLPGLILDAFDEKGTRVTVSNYTTAFEAISLESYRKIDPGYLVLASFQLVTGCTADLDSFLERKRKLTLEVSGRGEAAFYKEMFERDLFVNWGRACFSAKTPGKYTITAEESNDTILISRKHTNVKTVVGTIRSSPLTLTITE